MRGAEPQASLLEKVGVGGVAVGMDGRRKDPRAEGTAGADWGVWEVDEQAGGGVAHKWAAGVGAGFAWGRVEWAVRGEPRVGKHSKGHTEEQASAHWGRRDHVSSAAGLCLLYTSDAADEC